MKEDGEWKKGRWGGWREGGKGGIGMKVREEEESKKE